jgi:hypothetical protein
MLNEKEFRAIYDDYLASGLTIRDFCINQQMNEAKFFYWKNKLKDHLPPKRGFVPLLFDHGKQVRQVPAPLPGKPDTGSFQGVATREISCEILLPNGVCIKLNGSLDSELLRSLMVLTHQ